MARKEKIIIKKARNLEISPLRGGATADTIPTTFGRVVDPRDVITLAKILNQTIHYCDYCKRLNFTIFALLGPSPLTRLSLAELPVIIYTFSVNCS